MKPIAHIRSDFGEKFGIPRQSGLVPELVAQVIFDPPFNNPDVVRGLDEFSHIWLIWEFSEIDPSVWNPTVRPPRLKGERRGVFATRSPLRPNPIGLSCVELEKVEFDQKLGPILTVLGADLMDETPILDIKPYLATDLHPTAKFGFTSRNTNYQVAVSISEELLEKVPVTKRTALYGILAQDPRPHFHHDPERIYGVTFAGLNVRFKIGNDLLRVVEITDAVSH